MKRVQKDKYDYKVNSVRTISFDFSEEEKKTNAQRLGMFNIVVS